ncbi:hypothetical protein K2173_001092 [Erythroxylum novogranatense]|uniref:Ribosomal protein L19 n=1 Tax=Erythroxylum novogranatense TaxID=1862640 RepID=A0AAV8SIM6_9ROSI|nr:hypothetical protein K2173_001092 [Erythroxylum novogranatense]
MNFRFCFKGKMHSLCGRLIRRRILNSSSIAHLKCSTGYFAGGGGNNVHELDVLKSDPSVPHTISASENRFLRSFHQFASGPPSKLYHQTDMFLFSVSNSRIPGLDPSYWAALKPHCPIRSIATEGNSVESGLQDCSTPMTDVAPRIKFKRLDKTAKHIMQILDKEAVEEVRSHREVPDIKPGYIVELKVEVPENKRRVSIVRGIVIARRNAGLNTTFRLRRIVEKGIGVESLYPLYSPNIKEIKVLDKKKVRRAKLYYLREKMNALKKS